MSRLMEIFPSKSSHETVEERIQRHWEFVEGIPLPKWDMACGCGSTKMQLRNVAYVEKSTEPMYYPYRCFSSFKCTDCSRVQEYALVITEEAFKARCMGQAGAMYKWREALEIINGSHD